jgi:hypothetical protein
LFRGKQFSEGTDKYQPWLCPADFLVPTEKCHLIRAGFSHPGLAFQMTSGGHPFPGEFKSSRDTDGHSPPGVPPFMPMPEEFSRVVRETDELLERMRAQSRIVERHLEYLSELDPQKTLLEKKESAHPPGSTVKPI